MPFAFTHVCDLLQGVEDKTGRQPSTALIKQWFAQHNSHLSRNEVDGVALLSTLLPEERSDRVYRIQAKSLSSTIAKALGLGHSRLPELQRWKTPGLGVDLGDCVEGILQVTASCPLIKFRKCSET